MDKLRKMQDCLIDVVEGQIHGNLDKVDTKELGEAIDMIKDLSEAMYYCAITKAMEGEEEEEYESRHGVMYYSPKRKMMEHEPMVHYPESVDHVYRDGAMRDPHEGKSGERRKLYMQHKGTNDKNLQMKELEAYMQELSQDITEMIQDASPEEKQMLQGKISMLATKIK